MTAVLLVPWRPTPERQLLYDLIRPHLVATGLEVIEADSSAKVFSRAEALNLAAAQAPDADVLVPCDADSWFDAPSLHAAIAAVRSNPHGSGVVYGFDRWIPGRDAAELTAASLSEEYLEIPDDESTLWVPTSQKRGGRHSPPNGPVAISRDVWDRLGGLDQRFVGWGYEDCDFFDRVQEDAWSRGATPWLEVPGRYIQLHHSYERRYWAAQARNRILWLRWRKVRRGARR